MSRREQPVDEGRRQRRNSSRNHRNSGGSGRGKGNDATRRAASTIHRATAAQMATRQRDISVSEFFAKNRHLLGFDSPNKALLTTVKEAVDNSLDACEEAGILPEIWVEITEGQREGTFVVAVEDNGPGIVEKQIGKIFGKLLYGSKFHKLAQSRGQQGIGISAAGMYGQLTTGKPMRIVTRTRGRKMAWELVLSIDTTKNRPHLRSKEQVEWHRHQGTRVEIEMEASYTHGYHSVEMYLKQTAITNPHVTLHLTDPDGTRHTWPRGVHRLPRRPTEIKPHPHGLELGRLVQMLHDTRARHLKRFLVDELSRVGPKTADDILHPARAKVTARSNPHRIAHKQADALYRAINSTPISAPDTSCVVPIGVDGIVEGLQKEVEAQLYTAVSRPPAVYRGNPFVVEVGIAYGRPEVEYEVRGDGHIRKHERSRARDPERDLLGDADDPVRLLRFANRVPLLYQQSACAMTKAVIQTNWKSYGLKQPRGGLPLAPMAILVHVASVWVPFTSESKEAIAGYPEIAKELRLALQECGRGLQAHLRRTRKLQQEYARRTEIEKYLPYVGEALQEVLELSGRERRRVEKTLDDILHRSRQAP
ncbi:MAG: DNA topoisomerase VI subunit B [Polyangiales bacterium]